MLQDTEDPFEPAGESTGDLTLEPELAIGQSLAVRIQATLRQRRRQVGDTKGEPYVVELLDGRLWKFSAQQLATMTSVLPTKGGQTIEMLWPGKVHAQVVRNGRAFFTISHDVAGTLSDQRHICDTIGGQNEHPESARRTCSQKESDLDEDESEANLHVSSDDVAQDTLHPFPEAVSRKCSVDSVDAAVPVAPAAVQYEPVAVLDDHPATDDHPTTPAAVQYEPVALPESLDGTPEADATVPETVSGPWSMGQLLSSNLNLTVTPRRKRARGDSHHCLEKRPDTIEISDTKRCKEDACHFSPSLRSLASNGTCSQTTEAELIVLSPSPKTPDQCHAPAFSDIGLEHSEHFPTMFFSNDTDYDDDSSARKCSSIDSEPTRQTPDLLAQFDSPWPMYGVPEEDMVWCRAAELEAARVSAAEEESNQLRVQRQKVREEHTARLESDILRMFANMAPGCRFIAGLRLMNSERYQLGVCNTREEAAAVIATKYLQLHAELAKQGNAAPSRDQAAAVVTVRKLGETVSADDAVIIITTERLTHHWCSERQSVRANTPYTVTLSPAQRAGADASKWISGVSEIASCPEVSKFIAKVSYKGSMHCVGSYDTAEQAACVLSVMYTKLPTPLPPVSNSQAYLTPEITPQSVSLSQTFEPNDSFDLSAQCVASFAPSDHKPAVLAWQNVLD